MPPKDSKVEKTIYFAADGDEYVQIGTITDLREKDAIEDNIEHTAKMITYMNNAFYEFNIILKGSKEQVKSLAEILLPKYLQTERKFPKKKKRGSMRRRRWMKKEGQNEIR